MQTDTSGRAVIVLLVEDDVDLREAVALLLSEEGYVVYTAANGIEALTTLEEVRPALIITDLAMLGRNGWDLLDQLDQIPTLSSIPRIVITGAANATSRGFRAPVFVKPVRAADLVRAVQAYTRRRSPRGGGVDRPLPPDAGS